MGMLKEPKDFKVNPNDIVFFAYDLGNPEFTGIRKSYCVSSTANEMYTVQKELNGLATVTYKEDSFYKGVKGEYFQKEILSEIQSIEARGNDRILNIRIPLTKEIKEKLKTESYEDFCFSLNHSKVKVLMNAAELDMVIEDSIKATYERFFGDSSRIRTSPIAKTVRQIFEYMGAKLKNSALKCFSSPAVPENLIFTQMDIRSLLNEAQEKTYDEFELNDQSKDADAFKSIIGKYIKSFIDDTVFALYKNGIEYQEPTHEL